MSTLIGLWGAKVRDMSRVLKVFSSFMDSVPGMREGFLETRRQVKKPLAGDATEVLLVNPLGVRKRKAKEDSPETGTGPKRPRSLKKPTSGSSSETPPAKPQRPRERTKVVARPDLPAHHMPGDITMDPLTASDVEELEHQLYVYEFYM